MDPKAAIVGAAILAASIGMVALSGPSLVAQAQGVAPSCHTYEEQKSEACREYWNTLATDAGTQ